MKNNFGTNISWTLFGESHGPAIGITLDGLPAGFKVDMEQIKSDMDSVRQLVKFQPKDTKRMKYILFQECITDIQQELHLQLSLRIKTLNQKTILLFMEDCVLDMLILLPLKNTMDIKTIVVADTFPEDLPHAL